jgi:hypothetical protein
VVVAARGATLPARPELLSRAAQLEQRFGRLKLAARQWPRMIRGFSGVPGAAGLPPAKARIPSSPNSAR